MTNEILHNVRTPSSGLRAEQFFEGISLLTRHGGRNQLIGEWQELHTHKDLRQEEDALEALSKELGGLSYSEVSVLPVQSGLIEDRQDSRRLRNDPRSHTVLIKLPLYSEYISDHFAAEVDRIYLANLSDILRKDIYEWSAIRLKVDLAAENAYETLRQKHSAAFLAVVDAEIAEYLRLAWTSGEMIPHAAFTEVSKVARTRNKLPAQ